MPEVLYCYRCGESLAALTPPMSRQDMCPSCSNFLHVCRMCVNFNFHVLKQCREDDAEEVFDKEKANFCDWYKPSPNAFNASGKHEDDNARGAAEALFGEAMPDSNVNDEQTSAAEDLFK